MVQHLIVRRTGTESFWDSRPNTRSPAPTRPSVCRNNRSGTDPPRIPQEFYNHQYAAGSGQHRDLGDIRYHFRTLQYGNRQVQMALRLKFTNKGPVYGLTDGYSQFRTSLAAIAADTGPSLRGAFATEKGWIPLLNGRDLLGWRLISVRIRSRERNRYGSATSVSWSPEAPERPCCCRRFGTDHRKRLTTRTMNLDGTKLGTELYLEFLLAKTNPAFIITGLQLQVFDSYGSRAHIQRRRKSTTLGEQQGFGGNTPSHAARPPGQWQYFRPGSARRADASGAKKENASWNASNATAQRYRQRCCGRTTLRDDPEAAENLMLQGDTTSRISKHLFPPVEAPLKQ